MIVALNMERRFWKGWSSFSRSGQAKDGHTDISYRRHPGKKFGPADLARAVEGGDAKVPCFLGIVMAAE